MPDEESEPIQYEQRPKLWRDPLKILATAVAIVIVTQVVSQSYFPAASGFLKLASFLGIVLVIALSLMRRSGRL